MVGAILYSPLTYFIVFLTIALLTQLEFYHLLRLDQQTPLRVMGTLIGLALNTFTFLYAQGLIDGRAFLLLFPAGTLIYFIKLYRKKEHKPFTNIGFTFLGLLYVAVPFSLLHLAIFSRHHQQYSWQIILGCLLLLWASDSGAYFAGRRFGRTKLFERVSPKKSWEGSVGGLVSSMLVALILGYYFKDIAAYQWLILSGIIVVAGTYGDLVESLFKRSIDIKDSGSFLPGHGGFLDRFDGLLLAAPYITAYLALFP